MAFNMPAYYNTTMKPVSDNSLSTYSFQPKEVPESNSKRMGTRSDVPWLISRSRMEEAKGAQDTSISWQQMESHTQLGGGGK